MSDTANYITEADVKHYQALYKSVLGRDIDHDTALVGLHMLVRQMELVYKPITQEQLAKLKNEDEYNDGPSDIPKY